MSVRQLGRRNLLAVDSGVLLAVLGQDASLRIIVLMVVLAVMIMVTIVLAVLMMVSVFFL